MAFGVLLPVLTEPGFLIRIFHFRLMQSHPAHEKAMGDGYVPSAAKLKKHKQRDAAWLIVDC